MTNDTDPARPLGFFKRLRAKLNVGPAWLTADVTELLPGRKIDAGILDEAAAFARGRRHATHCATRLGQDEPTRESQEGRLPVLIERGG